MALTRSGRSRAFRRAVGAALTLGGLLLLASGVWAQGERTFRVECTATTSHVVAAQGGARYTATVTNQGTINVYLGFSTDNAPHQTLHAGASIAFQRIRDGLVCNTAGGLGGSGAAVVDVLVERP